MREIKFRAWTGGTMEYRVMAGWLGAFYVQGIDDKDTACMSPFNTIYSVQTPIMQFTGLKDKNGKEIYEGDIVSQQTRGNHWRPHVGQIDISPSQGVIVTNYHRETSCFPIYTNAEVIGNIYENPELLKS